MSEQYFATTANHKKVYVNFETSHVATHLSDTPQLLNLAREVIESIEVKEDNVYIDKDMGRVVGVTDLVKTSEKDSIIYAKRINRDNYTRFVKNCSAQSTSYVTVVLNKKNDGDYELFSAWIGRAVPQFPGDKYETPDSKTFWRNHALVWGSQSVQPNTELNEWTWNDN